VRELHTKKAINRIAITGGEPLVDLNSLNDILSAIESGGGSGYHISVNTNGINLPKLREMKKFSLLQDIHISRHSENDAENRRIFGIKVPTADQIKREIEQGPNIFSLSCNLLRGVIDSASRVRVYLDAAIDMGTNQVGFVSLMKKTDSCNSLFVDYEAIVSQFHVKDGFLFEEISRDRDSCKCENYRYFNDAGEIPIYLRRVLGGSKQDCVKAFIYGPDNLLVTNFGKDLVLA
jgi:molybdenum cofactor biosynthesis enzyme MoaA